MKETARMLTIRITEEEACAGTDTAAPDGLVSLD